MNFKPIFDKNPWLSIPRVFFLIKTLIIYLCETLTTPVFGSSILKITTVVTWEEFKAGFRRKFMIEHISRFSRSKLILHTTLQIFQLPWVQLIRWVSKRFSFHEDFEITSAENLMIWEIPYFNSSIKHIVYVNYKPPFF